MFIFPEGTRSASPVPSLLPFKKGAFHLAVQAGLPIVPIVCENYAHVYHSKARRFDAGEVVIRGADHPLLSLFSPCCAYPHRRAPPRAVLDPIPTTGVTSSHDDITALIDRTRGAMLAAIEQLGRERRAKMGEREALLPPRSGADAQEGEGEGETASARLDAPAPVHK